MRESRTPREVRIRKVLSKKEIARSSDLLSAPSLEGPAVEGAEGSDFVALEGNESSVLYGGADQVVEPRQDETKIESEEEVVYRQHGLED